MNTLIELISLKGEINASKVHYYTVKIEHEEFSEFEKFLLKHRDIEEVQEEFNDLLTWIEDKIGDNTAKEEYFRHEKEATALPPNSCYLDIEYDHDLRLYTYRISNYIVILLNGAIKTTDKAQDCPNVSGHFRFANKIARKLNKQFTEPNIELSPDLKELILNKDFEIFL